MPAIKPISRTASARPAGCATGFVVAFLGLFVAVGTGFGYVLSARPLYLAWQARSWTPTACDVVSSRIVESDGTSRADIVYRYEVGGRRYTADRYNFVPGLTGDSTVPAAVASHPPGATFECYVDPDDPSRAVINRTTTYWYYLGILFFALFAGVPAAAGYATLRTRRNHRTAGRMLTATQTLTATQAHSAGDGRFGHPSNPGEAAPLVLKPSASPLAKLLTITLICLFWNGIIGVFTYFEVRGIVEGQSFGWFLAFFLLLFQLVGVSLLVAVFHQLLALASPRPILTVSRGTVPLGASVSFGWELSGAAHRVSRLTISVRGREEARYRRGTDTHTDTNIFFSETLADVTHAMGIARGSGTIRIPADSMHTFTADNNKVIWSLHVAGEIARWPDVDETFDITVRPA
ncbi:MAG: DUF3592 domain-containing protein [Vicinamibacteraceae bacterium]